MEQTLTKITPIKSVIKCQTRKICKYMNRDNSSKAIRKRFLEYFINENNHEFVKSSPVVPYCDPTVPFVNAGMNQFKGIFLGSQTATFNKVANSQKCIRVGGKHNDLNIVGTDGYHHTFFEMLGNWSFGDYYKEEACKLSWNLLTKVYKLSPSQLYVTYFKGDTNLKIPEDLETREIWRKLGVKDDRILPFGVKDNFWEMGVIGPCGPCTEIHIDSRGLKNRSEFVNKGLHDLTEIWNIVFIEYNRNLNGTLSPLPQKHVDTGMGFERLTAILQGKTSNYDTDIFSYLLKATHKICPQVQKYQGKFGETDWDFLDTHYRVLADHIRMITVCLADGVIPEQNQKLRRVMRKTFLLSETTFKKDSGLLQELSNYVVEKLGPVYPELEKNIKQIQQILNYEEDVYKNIRESSSAQWKTIIKDNPKLNTLDVIESPGIVFACKDLSELKPSKIDGKLAFKLYDTFGLDEDCILNLATALNLPYNPKDLNHEFDSIKQKSKEGSAYISNSLVKELDQVEKTKDSFKYDFNKEGDSYKFKDLPVKVLRIMSDYKIRSEIKNDEYCYLILNQTNLYSEAGGQTSDKGVIKFDKGIFDVTDVQYLNEYIIHKGFYKSENGSTLKPNTEGIISINTDHRLNNMKNHTAVHLLNSVLKEIKGVTCQKSSKVTDGYLSLDVAIFGEKLKNDELKSIENRINDIISKKYPVNIREVHSQELLKFDQVTVIPGEVYPETGIRLIEIAGKDGFISREPCCGTHILNTGDIQDFSIIGLKSLGRSTASIIAVTADRAKLAKENADMLNEEILSLQKSIDDNIDKPEILEMAIQGLKHKLSFDINDESILSYYEKCKCTERLDEINKKIKEAVRGNFRDFIEMEMQNVLESSVKETKTNKKYIIHYLRSSMILEEVPLQKATKCCPDIPILVIAYANNMVKARCCVPKGLKSDNFNAEKWLRESVASVFNSRAAPPKGQDGTLVCNMKAKKVNLHQWDTLLNESLENAQKFVEENL